MKRAQSVWTLSMLAFALTGAWAQDNSTPPPSSDEPPASTAQQPVPAYGQDNAAPPISENPPLSGVDLPSLEPHAAPLSYLQPGATLSESAESNAGNALGGGGLTSVSRALGSMILKRLWGNYDLAMDYVGGVAYYSLKGQGWVTLQQMDIDQKILWKRGQLSLRDSFSYLPEGNFGGAYGSLGSQGIGSLGNSAFGSFWGGSSLGNLGLASRIMNVSLADVSENLSPRSTVTAAGGYAFTHYYGSDTLGTNFIGSSQISAQIGYNRLLTPRTQVAFVYGYQNFDFSVVGTAFHSQIIQGMYGHRISGRLDLLIGAGPQFTSINVNCTFLDVLASDRNCSLNSSGQPAGTIPTTKIGGAGQVRLRYQLEKTSLTLEYQRFDTSGSGLFLGAQSDIVHVNVNRPISRVWSVLADVGYSHNSRLQTLNQTLLSSCNGPGQPICPGIDANSYSYGFIGGGFHRSFGRNWHAFFSYQFNKFALDRSYCGGASACNRISNRNITTFGLDWTPRPIRID